MGEKAIFIIAGISFSAMQFVLYKIILPKFYKETKVPTYWQVFIPVLLFLISNAIYEDKNSLLWMFISYITVYAVLTAIFIYKEIKKIDREAENEKNQHIS